MVYYCKTHKNLDVVRVMIDSYLISKTIQKVVLEVVVCLKRYMKYKILELKFLQNMHFENVSVDS